MPTKPRMALFAAQPQPELQRVVLEFGADGPEIRLEPEGIQAAPEDVVALLLQVCLGLLAGGDSGE